MLRFDQQDFVNKFLQKSIILSPFFNIHFTIDCENYYSWLALDIRIKSVFRTLRSIYDETSFQKIVNRF